MRGDEGPLHEAPDAVLVALAAAGGPGHQEAYAALVRRYQASLLRYGAHLLHDRVTAEDVVQDAFVRAFMKLGELHDGAKVHAWLRTIVTRIAFNHQRSRSRRAEYEGRAPEPAGLPLPDAALEATEVMVKALAELPYPFREVIVLRHLEELSIAEIASTLDIGESAAKMRLKRARDDFFVIHARLVGHA